MPIIGPVIDSQYLVNNVDRFRNRTVESITTQERAEVALEEKSAAEDAVDEKLAQLKAANPGISSLGKYYNATGEPLGLAGQYSWHGSFARQGGGNNQTQNNGQWAVFVHNNPNYTDVDSSGAWIFSCPGADIVLAFLTPGCGAGSLPRIYPEIREKGHFTDNLADHYYNRLFHSVHHASDTNLGYKVHMDIEYDIPTSPNGSYATASAVVKLHN